MARCEPGHAHHWMIDAPDPENIVVFPDGGWLNGQCRHCGEQRLHRASLGVWGSDLNLLYHNDPALKLFVAPL